MNIFRHSRFPKVAPSERGAAILEAAILLPVLLLLFAGAYDGFRAMQAYSTLCEIGQEAARYAARVEILEPGTYNSGNVSTATTPGHFMVHSRIRGIIANKNWHTPLNAIYIISQYQDSAATNMTGELTAPPHDAALAGIIQIRIVGNYRGLFTSFLFANLTLQTHVSIAKL